jgi:hypothetical protein
MWREKTEAEKLAGKRSRLRRQILAALAAVAALLYVIATSPAWHGRKIWGLVLPVPRLVPDAIRNLALAGLLLGLGCWVYRWRANRSRTVVCRNCGRLKINDGQSLCQCGGEYLGLEEMDWVDGSVPPENQPDGQDQTNPKKW